MSNGWSIGCKIVAWVTLIGGVIAGIVLAVSTGSWWAALVGVGGAGIVFLFWGTLGYIAENVGISHGPSVTPEWISRSIQKKVDESVKASENLNNKPVTTVKEMSDGTWVCSCGRTNNSYVTTCVCGQNKREVLEKAREKAKERLITKEGAIICPQCKTKQASTRNTCWNCGYKFD